MSDCERFYPLPKAGINPAAWVAAALRGGMIFAIDDSDRLVRYQPLDGRDPGPDLAWRALCEEFDRYRRFVEPVLRRRIAAEGVAVSFRWLADPGRDTAARPPAAYRILAGSPCIDAAGA